MSDLYLGEILRSRGYDVIAESNGDYKNPAMDAIVITIIVDYIREQDYLDVSKLSDQQLYDKVKDYLDHNIPAHIFMEELEAKYPVRSNVLDGMCMRTDCGKCKENGQDKNCPYTE